MGIWFVAKDISGTLSVFRDIERVGSADEFKRHLRSIGWCIVAVVRPKRSYYHG